MRDPYLDMIDAQWHNILMMYKITPVKRPVMLFDVQAQKILVYAYKEFKASLNQRSQALLKEQYREAQRNNQMVLFVRDNAKQKFKSYSLDLD